MSEREKGPEGEGTEPEGALELEIQSGDRESEAQGGAPQDRVWVSLNEASETELEQLPGIGQVLAARIVDYRNENGDFDKAEDVVSVPGVSAPMYERIAGYLTVASTEDAVASDLASIDSELVDAAVEQVATDELDEDGSTIEAEDALEAATDAVDSPEGAGIGDALPEQLEPGERVGAVEPVDALDVKVEAAVDEPLELEEEGPVVESLVVPTPGDAVLGEDTGLEEPDFPPLEVAPERPAWSCLSLVLVGLLAAAVGALLALGALRMINGTLNFRAATARDLQAEAIRLDGEIGQIHGSLDGVQERLGAIEEFGPRLVAVEADVDWLTGEMEAMQREMDRLDDELVLANDALATLASNQSDLEENVTALQVQLDLIEDQVYSLQSEMDAVRQAADRFDSFLRGLDELLGETVGTLSEEPPSLPRVQTPQPTMIVIPLSTPTP